MKKVEGVNSFSVRDYLVNLGFFGLVAEFIVFGYIVYILYRRGKRKALSRIQEQLMEVRKKLKENLHYDAAFRFTVPRQRYIYSLLTNVKDYIIVDDFYSKLGERDDYIRKNQDTEIDLAEQNKRTLELAEDALEKIDWSKYM
jgi:hypothetical protein